MFKRCGNTIYHIIRDGMAPGEAPASSEDPAVPDLGVMDDNNIADLLQLMRELNQHDKA